MNNVEAKSEDFGYFSQDRTTVVFSLSVLVWSSLLEPLEPKEESRCVVLMTGPTASLRLNICRLLIATAFVFQYVRAVLSRYIQGRHQEQHVPLSACRRALSG